MTNAPTGTSVVRAINARAALRLLLDRSPLTRPEIAAELRVSKPTASRLLAELQETGLVRSDDKRDGAIGRAAELFRVEASAAHVAALDVTPERIAVAVADLVGTRVGEYELPTPEGATVDPAERVRAALDGACESAGIRPADLRHVVVGIQGAIDPVTDRLRFAAHLHGWQGQGLTKLLRDRIGAPVAIENDVNLVTIAEDARDRESPRTAAGTGGLAPDGLHGGDFAVLWVSDGIGMGLMFGGRLHRGLTGGAGEIADLPLPGAPTAAEPCPTGTYGMQGFAAGPAIAGILGAHGFTGATPADALRAAVGSRTEAAQAALDEIAQRLALGLVSVVAIVDPASIVLAGDLSLAGSERLRALVQDHLYAATVARPAVVLTRLEGNPVLDGALRLALETAQDEALEAVTGGRRT